MLQVDHLSTSLYAKGRVVKAVDDVSFAVHRGECVGLVGESGSGKTITCLSIMQLLPRVARIIAGSVTFDSDQLLGKSAEQMRAYRGRRMAMILQDPFQSLNPAFTIGNQVMEAVRLRRSGSPKGAMEQVISALRAVKLPAAEQRVHNYPHELSGGMRQRVVGAMAVAGQAELIIADEPTTALDATIQAEYLALLSELQRDRHLAILFVTHDLGVVSQICDRVAVMYAGKLVELADVETIFDEPAHPYTQALLGSLPQMAKRGQRLPSIPGQPPDLANLPRGCAFAARCPVVMDRCHHDEPPLVTLTGGHAARCWRAA